ncbi:zinc-binding metallopeptidase [Sphingobacterium sp. UBA6320]|jgi:substrate import-associated zinc metallohydrolase lipoprotein|uniref:zinc-binding metallopeptidase n=1 Tax=Sphingobacterium sp. UBA6320 TaxID=1947510 RepID=UPI0025F64D2D|nr:putative zinc-binding metallopeptidase [Sphingobacterium sp. UBA6320]
MKVNYKLIPILISCGLLFSACSKEDKLDSKSVFVDSEIPKNALDNYLYNTYTKPYNVEILYKYVDKESDMTYRLVPAPYESSIRLSKLMNFLIMEPYTEVAGSKQFLKNNFPKIITYTGSVPVQTNGVIILGTAESGTKVSLYNLLGLNETSGKDVAFLTGQFFKTIHHEFQHILNQNKAYPSNFKEITGTSYVEDDWNSTYPATAVGIGNAIAAGFISPYASKADTEDFAELYSYYVTRSQADFDAMLNVTGSTAAGRALILSKLAIVKSYMKSEWEIDMDVLRANILARYPQLSTFDQTTLN